MFRIDSTIELLNPLPPPPHRGNSKPYPFCFSLNTAGSNRILLSCPSEYDRTLFVSALRLSAWEKSRLEEIYTGHLLRTFVSGGRAPVVTGNANPNWNEPDASLSKGTMEGWVRVRVMGTIEWKRLWLVLRAPVSAAGSNNQDAATASGEKKRKGLFSFASHDKHPAAADHGAGVAGVASTRPPGMEDGVAGASAVFYREAPVRGKGNKNVVPPEPLLQITHVTQA
jgi:CCR4-NOT transcriptional complex subunit CAF120